MDMLVRYQVSPSRLRSRAHRSVVLPVIDGQIRSAANHTPSPPTTAAAQTLLFPSYTPSSSGAALPSPVNAFPLFRTSYLFPFFPGLRAPIPLAFIIQPSLLSIFSAGSGKNPKIHLFQSPIWAGFCFLSSFPFIAIIIALLHLWDISLAISVAYSSSLTTFLALCSSTASWCSPSADLLPLLPISSRVHRVPIYELHLIGLAKSSKR
jgi:hypothetical protein